MPRMPSLRDVSREWERLDGVREHVRKHKTLLQWIDADSKKVCIKNADLNFLVLNPLAARLRDDEGNVGMLCVPDIMSQNHGPLLLKNP